MIECHKKIIKIVFLIFNEQITEIFFFISTIVMGQPNTRTHSIPNFLFELQI